MSPSRPSTDAARAQIPGRLGYVDNIRWTTIALVLSMHAADTYSPFGNWYYTERPALGLPSVLFFFTYQSFLQAFFMGLLFFIAGYFVPRSYDAKGPRRFLRDRFVRLGIPTLLYMLVIDPVTEYFISHSWRTTKTFAGAWWEHIANGQVLSESGPLWFCLALLIFSAAYAACRSLIPRRSRPRDEQVGPLPRGGATAALIVILGLVTFAVRIPFPSGTSFLNLQIPDFPQYILLFVLGLHAYRHDWLARLDTTRAARMAAWALLTGLALWGVLLLFGGARAGHTEAYSGGLHWQNLAMSVWAALICAGATIGSLILFRTRFPDQGRLARLLSDNAFAVYVFHPPILIAIALLLHPVSAPGVLKFAVLTVLANIASFAAAQTIFRRIPGLRRIL